MTQSQKIIVAVLKWIIPTELAKQQYKLPNVKALFKPVCPLPNKLLQLTRYSALFRSADIFTPPKRAAMGS